MSSFFGSTETGLHRLEGAHHRATESDLAELSIGLAYVTEQVSRIAELKATPENQQAKACLASLLTELKQLGRMSASNQARDDSSENSDAPEINAHTPQRP